MSLAFSPRRFGSCLLAVIIPARVITTPQKTSSMVPHGVMRTLNQRVSVAVRSDAGFHNPTAGVRDVKWRGAVPRGGSGWPIGLTPLDSQESKRASCDRSVDIHRTRARREGCRQQVPRSLTAAPAARCGHPATILSTERAIRLSAEAYKKRLDKIHPKAPWLSSQPSHLTVLPNTTANVDGLLLPFASHFPS